MILILCDLYLHIPSLLVCKTSLECDLRDQRVQADRSRPVEGSACYHHPWNFHGTCIFETLWLLQLLWFLGLLSLRSQSLPSRRLQHLHKKRMAMVRTRLTIPCNEKPIILSMGEGIQYLKFPQITPQVVYNKLHSLQARFRCRFGRL